MQKGYEWILQEPGPKMILEAIKLYGTKEIDGKESNPVIMGWANEVGLKKQYSDDNVPWCGLVMAVIAKRAGKPVPPAPLWALNWAKFGTPVPTAMFGDVITFFRKVNGKVIGGHVGLYVGEDKFAYHIFGGNQKNAFNISRLEKDRKNSITRPPYIQQPDNVRKIILQPEGIVSLNEA